MYSVVLMVALSGGTEAVGQCHGCAGVLYGGCYGGGYGGCNGGRCHGGLFAGHRSRCHGGGGYACNGGCRGGWFGGGGCHGCRGGYGYGCTGGYGYGCCGGYGYGGAGYGGCAGCCGGVIITPGTGTPPVEKIKQMPKEKKVSAPATILVFLPASAKLRVDGNPTTSVSAQRTLITPALDLDSSFTYTLQAELDGQMQTQQIVVRGGQTTEARFTFEAQGVANR